MKIFDQILNKQRINENWVEFLAQKRGKKAVEVKFLYGNVQIKFLEFRIFSFFSRICGHLKKTDQKLKNFLESNFFFCNKTISAIFIDCIESASNTKKTLIYLSYRKTNKNMKHENHVNLHTNSNNEQWATTSNFAARCGNRHHEKKTPIETVKPPWSFSNTLAPTGPKVLTLSERGPIGIGRTLSDAHQSQRTTPDCQRLKFGAAGRCKLSSYKFNRWNRRETTTKIPDRQSIERTKWRSLTPFIG